MIYTRDLYPKLEKELHTKEATVITGMRRVGKSTALRHLYSLVFTTNKAFFDLEDPITRELFDIRDYETIWPRLAAHGISHTSRAYIFLDEIQNLPSVTSLMKYLIDHHQTKFIVSGSSSYYLKNLFPQSLSGRKLVFEMYPLTFHEFLDFRRSDIKLQLPAHTTNLAAAAKNKLINIHSHLAPLYIEYLSYGGYPAVVLEPDYERKSALLRDIFKSYFELDVKSLADFRDIELLRSFILLLIPRIGSKLDITKISSEMGISRETVHNYLIFLESTYLITRLSRYSKSTDKVISGSQKLYFSDSGLAQSLGMISPGQALEQSVFQSLHPLYELAYYATSNGGEIDFVVDKKIALEVKKHVIPRDIANLRKRMESAKLTEGYVVTHDYSDLEDTILASDI